MQQLSAQGQQFIQDLAQRYGVSTDAAITMLYAVMNGNGTMAGAGCIDRTTSENDGFRRWLRAVPQRRASCAHPPAPVAPLSAGTARRNTENRRAVQLLHRSFLKQILLWDIMEELLAVRELLYLAFSFSLYAISFGVGICNTFPASFTISPNP